MTANADDQRTPNPETNRSAAGSGGPVARGDERAIFSCPDHMLLLCWPPWQSDMARNALTCHRGEYFAYVGEWIGGCANLRFFAQLVATFEPVEQVNIPQWYNRDDSLMIFRRRSGTGQH
jgi:hypothetical protein